MSDGANEQVNENKSEAANKKLVINSTMVVLEERGKIIDDDKLMQGMNEGKGTKKELNDDIEYQVIKLVEKEEKEQKQINK